MNFTIQQILDACKGRFVYCGQEAEKENFLQQQVSCVELDSRRIQAGGVFVATVGQRVDGHSFIPKVAEQGAALVIAEKEPTDAGVSYLLVPDSFCALKEMAEAYRKTLTIPIVGITGSVGKTSTKEFIAGVLEQKYQVLKTRGNYNNEVGVPLTLLQIRPEHQAAVVEMGISDFGEMHRLSKMARPDIAVITNIGQCHLENLKTRDGILQAKTEIFDYMPENAHICLNGEDDKLADVQVTEKRKLHFFGLGENPAEQVWASDIVSKGLWGSSALLHAGAELSYQVEVPLPGIHMVTNAAAAACVGQILGLTEEEIIRGIGSVGALSGRNNLIRCASRTIIDDCYNANPVSMRAGIDLLQMADTYTVALLGDMFELGENSDALHAQVGAYAVERGVDRLICVGENSRHMFEAARTAVKKDSRLTEVPDKCTKDICYFSTKEELIKRLQEGAEINASAAQDGAEVLLPENCTVLIKASHGMAFGELVTLLSK